MEAVLAVAKTGDVAVRGWGGDSAVGVATWGGWIVAVLATDVAKTGGGDVDIATRENEIFVILAVAVITAKTDGLLAKNIAKRGDNKDKNIEKNPF